MGGAQSVHRYAAVAVEHSVYIVYSAISEGDTVTLTHTRRAPCGLTVRTRTFRAYDLRDTPPDSQRAFVVLGPVGGVPRYFRLR